MIRIASVEEDPIHEIPYEYVGTGGVVSQRHFPIHRALAVGLPEELSALIILSDLQGVELPVAGRARRLLGEVVAEELIVLCELGLAPPAKRTGVILAGDLHVSIELDRCGGKGDVRKIWNLFREGFRWVAGVAGNHDRFGGDASDLGRFTRLDRLCYLDGDAVTVDALRLGGVGGIIGNPAKPFRRTEGEFVRAAEQLVADGVDLLVLHEGPEVPGSALPGSAAVRTGLETCPATLVICGHTHWASPDPQVLSNGT